MKKKLNILGAHFDQMISELFLLPLVICSSKSIKQVFDGQEFRKFYPQFSEYCLSKSLFYENMFHAYELYFSVTLCLSLNCLIICHGEWTIIMIPCLLSCTLSHFCKDVYANKEEFCSQV